MSKCIGYAILVYACSNVAGIGLYLVQSIAHSHACAGSFQHRNVVAAIAKCHCLTNVYTKLLCYGAYAVSLIGIAIVDIAESWVPSCRCETL